MRHTCASLLEQLGVPARDAMEILGHSRISVTMEVYTHVTTAERRDARSKIDRLLVAVATDELEEHALDHERRLLTWGGASRTRTDDPLPADHLEHVSVLHQGGPPPVVAVCAGPSRSEQVLRDCPSVSHSGAWPRVKAGGRAG
ncbi:MAG: tyrosine-type recombinase/integrase [Carbonactinosporaceae bacterium]